MIFKIAGSLFTVIKSAVTVSSKTTLNYSVMFYYKAQHYIKQSK